MRWTLAFALGAILPLGLHAAEAPAAAGLPRTADGRPDISGIWQALTSADVNIQDHSASEDGPAGQGIVEGNEIPYQPWAAKKKQENFAARATADPSGKCFLPGVPRITYTPHPFQILQGPKELTFLYEYAHAVRTVFLTGKHPEGHIDWWLGDSRGKWEGDSLVVDVVHFNDQTWFDHAGNFHSDALHVVERYTPIGKDHLRYEATIEDTKVFTRPWKINLILYRRLEKNAQLLDYDCYAFKHEKLYP